MIEWWVWLIVALLALFVLIQIGRGLQYIAWASKTRHSMGPAPYDPKVEGLHRRYFKSMTTGLWVFHRSWFAPAGTARAAVILMHGIGEHCGRYEHVADVLTAAGVDVHALDHQGHGQSEGDRCYFERFAHLAEDVVQLVTAVKREALAGKPVYLLGHSMGALVALHVAAHPAMKGRLSGMILSGPPLVIDPAIDTPLNRFAGGLLSNWLPKAPVQALDTIKLCSDVQVVAQYKRDPLNFIGAMRARVGIEMLAAIARANAFAPDLSLPTFVQHGERDIICGVEGSKRYVAAMTGAPEKTLKIYDALFHEIYNEVGHGKILADVVAWLEPRLPPAAARRAGAAAA